VIATERLTSPGTMASVVFRPFSAGSMLTRAEGDPAAGERHTVFQLALMLTS
jgi:hypothetical protein